MEGTGTTGLTDESGSPLTGAPQPIPKAEAAQRLDLRLPNSPQLFVPFGDRCFVQEVPPEEKSHGGILIPQVAQEKTSIGVVIEVGPECVRTMKGMWLMYAPYVGQEIQIQGTKFLVFREDEALGEILYEGGDDACA